MCDAGLPAYFHFYSMPGSIRHVCFDFLLRKKVRGRLYCEFASLRVASLRVASLRVASLRVCELRVCELGVCKLRVCEFTVGIYCLENAHLRWLHTLFIIGELVPNLEFSRENVKNICKNKYNFFSLKSEPQVMFILMF
jgi:hypothetical protein